MKECGKLWRRRAAVFDDKENLMLMADGLQIMTEKIDSISLNEYP